uniref:BPI2 domain-containing protein n=1 Tax=Steinernema glaseri TaxID=37863 RepID=A0A1I7YRK1_9BILA
MRVRLNDPVYYQAENIIEALFSWQVHRTVIPTQQQCFAEGCVSIFNFRMSSFRPPATIALQPTPPNVLALTLKNFDLDITGQVTGTLQMLLPIPVTGRILVHARNVVLRSEMEMQKTRGGVAFMKLSSCGIQGGFVDAKIVDMGLFTDTVNTKYRNEIVDKAKSLLESVLCDNVNKILKSEFNARLADIPKKLYMEDVVEAIMKMANETKRVKRDSKDFVIKGLSAPEGRVGVATIKEITRKTSIRLQDALKTKRLLNESSFFSPSKFEGLYIDLDMLDTSATKSEFTIGVDGTVLKEQAIQVDNIPYKRPERIRFAKNQKKRMLELLISEYTLNSLLFQSFSFNALKFHISGKTPILGPLLRTSCSLDEVCLSDSIEEAAEQYPDKQLELVVYPSKAPRITMYEDSAELALKGLSEYYLEESGEQIGSIPFSADVQLGVNTKDGKVYGSLKVKNLEFLDPVDFFGLSVENLDGLRKATVGAVENLAKQKLETPIDLNEISRAKFERFGMQNVTVKLLEQGAAMVQADFDLYRTFYGQ